MSVKYGVQTGLASAVAAWGTILTGTLTFTLNSANVTGSSTLFTTELSGNKYILGYDGNWYQVSSITDNTHLVLTGNYGSATHAGTTSYVQVSAVPAEGDSVVINASVTITIENTYIWGDDTVTGIQLNGTLKASRTASSFLTCKGHLLVNSGGTFDYGTSGDHSWSAGVTHTVILNYSGTMAAGKYGIYCKDGGNFYTYGNVKTINTTATAQVNNGQAVVQVADATGWSAGDKVAVATTESKVSSHHSELMTIATGGVSGNTITMTGNFVYTHLNGVDVGNFTNNITFKSYDSTKCGFVYLYTNTTASARYLRYNTFYNLGSSTGSDTQVTNAAYKYGMLTISSIATITPLTYTNISDLSFLRDATPSDTGNFAINWFSFAQQVLNVNNIAVYDTGRGIFYFAQNSKCTLTNSVIYSCLNASVFSAGYSAGGINVVIDNVRVLDVGGSTFYLNPLISGSVTNSKFCSAVYALTPSCVGNLTFTNCDFGVNYPVSGNTGATNQYHICTSTNMVANITATNCRFGIPSSGWMYQWNLALLGAFTLNIINKNSDITQQEQWLATGTWYRDNTTFLNSPSSLKLATALASISTLTSYSISVPASNGETITLCGNVQYNASYRNSGAGFTAPTVTISGLGISPVTFTATVDVGHDNTWQPYLLQATNSSGADGNFTVTFSGQSLNTSGLVYFDGLDAPPFITACRFYGYLEDRGNPKRAVDPYVSASVTTAAAYTGISLNYTTKVITVTTNHTLQKIYDYSKYSDQLAANLAQPVTLTTTDGIHYTFASGWGLTITAATISASGKSISMTGTYTQNSGGTTTGTVVDAAGTHTFLTLLNVVAGSRYGISKVSDGSQVAEGEASAATVTIPYLYTADVPVTVRVRKGSANPKYAEFATTGTITVNGLSITVNQIEDTIAEAV